MCNGPNTKFVGAFDMNTRNTTQAGLKISASPSAGPRLQWCHRVDKFSSLSASRTGQGHLSHQVNGNEGWTWAMKFAAWRTGKASAERHIQAMRNDTAVFLYLNVSSVGCEDVWCRPTSFQYATYTLREDQVVAEPIYWHRLRLARWDLFAAAATGS